MLPERALPSRAWPDVPPLGPGARYGGMSPPQLRAAEVRLLAAEELWREQMVRLRSVGIRSVVSGPCASAMLAARTALTLEFQAIANELTVQRAELRRAAAAGASATSA